ncbi:integrase catalytic domain-containing protein [Trichonephila inaurata madagascariensis]|uniref:Integrase catalytic domain-containing protein n=1 Tax=Trichonephila inaurata madagascariensis TaxID=2747483 RepID=A0A8X6YMR1_9ARAC|nr:integrase catalytic domain-containing protein [Trichonephila inaurata madagascariensis]
MFQIQSMVRSKQRPQLSIKLPEIPLPKFSGKYEKWSNFKIQFNNIISTNSQLSSEQKLHYLKAALTFETKNLETISDSFESSFKSLEERYENERLIAETQVKAILNLAKLNNESAKDLRNLIDDVNKNIRALKVLEFERNNLSDILILNNILQKLDKETLKQFEYSLNSTENPKSDDFILFLEKCAQVLSNVNKNSFVKSMFIQDRNKSKIFFIKSNNSAYACILCNQRHPIYKCDSFLKLNVIQRKEIVTKHMCLNCLSDQHTISKCKSKHSCSVCGFQHNTLLHRQKRESVNAPLIYSASPLQGQELNPNAEDFRSSQESTAASLSSIVEAKP